ncbi:MAG: DUF4250 domain-containing protein [Clostridiales bacterium]|nr:DUF4250 domain-containing protein [Clostridiales bacterium]
MLPKNPVMLLSFVNTRLRDEYDSLEELCAALDVSRSELEERLASIGYQYNEQTNQFI